MNPNLEILHLRHLNINGFSAFDDLEESSFLRPPSAFTDMEIYLQASIAVLISAMTKC